MYKSVYTCEKYGFLLFGTKEMASEAASGDDNPILYIESRSDAVVFASLWSKRLRTKVHVLLPKDIILVLSKERELWHVLAGEKTGWIIVPQWTQLKEIC
jgi:hypothetical protein